MSAPPFPLRIGTRGSPLALAQAHQVRDRLLAAHPNLGAERAPEIVVVTTTGDRVQDRPLSEIGGKGLFAKELQQALRARDIDLAVHSMKDVETWQPDDLDIACMLERADPRDGFVSAHAAHPRSLPDGAVVGTASLRRQAQLLAMRPDLKVVPLRGNVQTRLRKLADGEVDATLLALAGLVRLDMADVATAILPPEDMLPAACQGVIGVEIRADDGAVRALLAPLDHAATAQRAAAERAALAALDGSCRTPIGALAELDGQGGLRLDVLVAEPEGRMLWRTRRDGRAADGAAMGTDAGTELRRAAGDRVFAAG